MLGSRDLVVSQDIAAPPDVVFTYFTSAERWLLWQGVAAEIDPRPGGVLRVNVRGDGYASGEFVTIEPPRLVVFTFGWDIPGNPIRPGTTTVRVELEPTETGTHLTLTHSGLPGAEAVAMHRHGWEHYLPRCAQAAVGADPGPDPAAAPA